MADYLLIRDILVFTIVLVCVFTDLKDRKIYNLLAFPGMLCGIFLNILASGIFHGTWFGIKGIFIGIAFFFIPFVLKGISAGDLKLLGMIGSFLGFAVTLKTAVATAIYGGIIAIAITLSDKANIEPVWLFIRNSFFAWMFKLPRISPDQKNISKRYFPYSISILLGLLTAYFYNF